MSGPLAPVFTWSWHRAALAVFVHCAFFLFPASGRLSTLTPRPSYRTPYSPSLLSSFGDMVTHTPSPPSESPPLSLILPLLARAGSAPWLTLSPQREPSVYPIHAVSTSSVLCPTSVRHYKMPLVLALLLHPHTSQIRSRATRSSHHCGTRFVRLR